MPPKKFKKGSKYVKYKHMRKTRGTQTMAMVVAPRRRPTIQLGMGPAHKHPFPNTCRKTLFWNHELRLANPGSALIGTHQLFYLNCPYDVLLAGAGALQPFGWDQMGFIYQRYRVEAVDINLVLDDPSADGLSLIYRFNNQANATQDMSGLVTENVVIQPNTGQIYLNNTGDQLTKKNWKRIPMHKLMGITKAQYNSNLTSFTSLITANPAAGYRCGLEVACQNSSGTAGGPNFKIELAFHLLYEDRVTLANSTV